MDTMNSRTRSITAAAGAVSLASVLFLAACSGGTSITTPGGEAVSINPSGGISISDSAGSIVVGSDKLPDGFPSDVATPPGFTVGASAKTQVDGKDAYTVTFTQEGDQGQSVSDYIDTLKASGFKIDSQFGGSASPNAGGVWQLSNSKWQIGLIESVESGKTAVILNVMPASN